MAISSSTLHPDYNQTKSSTALTQATSAALKAPAVESQLNPVVPRSKASAIKQSNTHRSHNRKTTERTTTQTKGHQPDTTTTTS
jgi:hypothetical protein